MKNQPKRPRRPCRKTSINAPSARGAKMTISAIARLWLEFDICVNRLGQRLMADQLWLLIACSVGLAAAQIGLIRGFLIAVDSRSLSQLWNGKRSEQMLESLEGGMHGFILSRDDIFLRRSRQTSSETNLAEHRSRIMFRSIATMLSRKQLEDNCFLPITATISAPNPVALGPNSYFVRSTSCTLSLTALCLGCGKTLGETWRA